MKFRLLPVILSVCAMTVLFVLPARATIMKYLEIEDLTRLSSDIFQGQVVSTDTIWNQERTRIYTLVRVRVNETFKGRTRLAQIVTVTQFGGEKDGIKMDYLGRPDFKEGESVVLFTTRGKGNDLTVVALKQGKMNLIGNEIKRDFSGITLVDSLAQGKTLHPISMKSSQITIDELRNRIAKTK